MKTMRKMTGLTTLIVALLVAGTANAAVEAIITKAGTGKKIRATVKWQATIRKYMIKPAGSAVTFNLSPSDVADIQVERPPELDSAIKQVRSGNYVEALPVLAKIMRTYTMLQHDVTAATYLAHSYLKTKDPRQAADVCDRLIRSNPPAAQDDQFAVIYWEVLLETEQYSKLNKALDIVIEGGSRQLAAVAQIRRGDIAKKKGNLDDALIDGYLRTVVFFQAIKSVQPEALYKAATCFEEKGEHSYADKMRKELLSSYPQSEQARQLRAGA